MKESFSNKMERKFGKYAIPNISLYLIICYAFGYIIQMINPAFVAYLTLEPGYILRGQIWRIFTWILIPPNSGNIFFTLIMLYFYYNLGRSLEAVWGTYRYNCYLFSGMFFTVLGSFVLYIVLAVMGLPGAVGFGPYFSTYYINMSIFLAYAATFPDMQVFLMFVIPVRVKYLGIIYGIILAIECIQGGLILWVVIGSSLLNFVVFYFTSKRRVHISPKQIKRRTQYKAQVRRAAGVTKHKCAICGRTEETNPELEFRFCSKCNGNYEYCQEHLFSHKHVI